MTNINKAAQQALEALESKYIVNCGAWRHQQDQAITALRAALAEQPAEQESQTEDVAADAYSHACDEMVRWQRERRKSGKEVGTTGSLCDGIAWLYLHIDKLERTAMAEQPVEQGDDFSQCKPPMRHIPGVRVDLLRKAAAPEDTQPAKREPLTDEEIERGREATFSTGNPFCPCDSKTMRKAVRWAERTHGIGGQP